MMMLSRRGTSLICACSRHQRHSYLRRLSSSGGRESSEKKDAFIVDQIKSFSIGSLAGLLGSLAGMGGGFVMIPMMTASRGLRLTQHQAHGTSLFAVGSTGLFGALAYGIRAGEGVDIANDSTDTKTPQQQGLVELDIALALTATAVVTARFGAITSSKLSERSLKRALGAFMLVVAPLVPGKKYLDALLEDNSNESKNKQSQTRIENSVTQQSSTLQRLLPASFIGMFSGFLSGLFGVGGGAIVVPAIVLSTDMSHHAALGTSLCAMVLPSMVGVLTHAKRGNVAWRVASSLALGSAAGAYIGGKEIGLHLEEDVLRGGFGALMLVLGARTWRTAG
ncbi:hypothetical protein ACHAXM_006164 [Skeletonema potamos]